MQPPMLDLERLATRLIVVALAVLLNLYLFRFYRPDGRGAAWGTPGPRTARWAFSPASLGGFSYAQLALVSVLGLFLELLMIRWISAEIPIFAYFKNFVLIACFLGFGLGCYLCRQRVNLLALLYPLGALVLLMKLPWYNLRELIASLAPQLGALSEVQVLGVPSLPLTWASFAGLVTAVAVIVALFALIPVLFISLR